MRLIVLKPLKLFKGVKKKKPKRIVKLKQIVLANPYNIVS